MATAMRTGVYPGTFDPATVAHLHVAEAALEQCSLDRVDLTISEVTLGKDDETLTAVEHRVADLAALGAGRPWLGVRTTAASLLADIAEGYDVLVVGADKWHQLVDPTWYGSTGGRDRALARLPIVAVAPRPPWTLPSDADHGREVAGLEVVVLRTDPVHHPVSATEVRAGRLEWRARP
jgi:nicotinic acid mononucleotide adenylyltransferase